MSDTYAVDSMRDFVVAVMAGIKLPERHPPLDLVRINHLGPIAFRMGMAAFRNEYAASMVMAERRRDVLAELVRTLGERGIDLALIKGIGYVGTIYPDPAQRPMNDIDLLVPSDRFADALVAMKESGFQRTGFTRKLSPYYHATAFLRGPLMIELHRNIVQPYRTGLRIEDMWKRASLDPLGSGAKRLEPVDDLLICALHIARHELAAPALNYLDVWRLWGKLDSAQRELFRTRAREYRIARAIDTVLSMTENLASGASGPPAVGRSSRLFPTTDHVLRGVHPSRLRQIGQKLVLAEGLKERLGLGVTTVAAIVDGWWRSRSENQR